MNYKDLLKKYINHVGMMEGIDFLGGPHKGENFTQEEWVELKEISNEVLNELEVYNG